MEQLLRTLVTLRGLILAGTVITATAGSYLVQGTAFMRAGVHSQQGSPVYAVAGQRIPAQQNTTVLCTPYSPTYVALPCA